MTISLHAVRRADRRLFIKVARMRSRTLDRALPELSRAANLSRIWIAIAASLRMSAGRSGRRAALRGLTSIVVTSAVVNLALKPVVRRARPSLRLVPVIRHLAGPSLTTSFPSGHSASAAAFAVGASLELPPASPVLAGLAAAVGFSRVYTGAHYPGDVVVGWAVGAAVALVTRGAIRERSR